MKVLLTGGAGYIGSHVAVELCEAGHEVVIVDNLSNSSPTVVDRIREITGAEVGFYELDVRNEGKLLKIFKDEDVDAVIHLAGLKAVGESVEKPLEYYDNNINSMLTVLRVMKRCGVKKLVFSSTATVYGSSDIPYTEESQVGVGITNPYSRTKYMIEEILKDFVVANAEFEVILLRYFNPIGAHRSGQIGEDPNGIPNNLVPYVAQVAVGKLERVNVYGDDYDTVDGTGVRDYIHVVDLAKGHVLALKSGGSGVRAYNLGTGAGKSVLEVIGEFGKVAGRDIPYRIVGRRAGDLGEFYARADKARRELGWVAELGLKEMCEDTWRWQSRNPDGYR